MITYIGIDPGLSGAVAQIVWKPDFEGTRVDDIPVAVVKATKRDYLLAEMYKLFARPGQKVAIVERQIAMPRQASTSTFTTGRGQGIIEGLLTGLAIPYEMVDPAKWKKALGIPPGSDKGASRVMAMRLFPQLAGQLARVKDDGRADALLLAEYLRRIRTGQ